MQDHIDHLRKVTSEFKAELDRCAVEPEEECVHHVRTGTRRVQAMVETILREVGAPSAELARAAGDWLKDLKKTRRAAAPVRDLDVHRGLLKKLLGRDHKGKNTLEPHADAVKADAGLIASSAQALPSSLVEQQADRLDAWLKHAREHQAESLKKEAAKRSKKLADRETEFEAALAAQARSKRRNAPKSATLVALEAFVRLSDEIPMLDEANLHDFRKGAKNARYIAESGGDDASAQAVAKALKKLQDDIGDWHDWLVLSEEARTALHDAGELFAILDGKVAKLYASSLRTAARLRGQLMGEWQALRIQPRRRRPTVSQAEARTESTPRATP